MSKPQDPHNSKAPGYFANQRQSASPAPLGTEERHQATRERAPTDQERHSASAPGPAEGSPADADREERIRRRAYQLWEEDGRQDGRAEDHWHRAVQDLDREDAELQRSGSSGKDRT